MQNQNQIIDSIQKIGKSLDEIRDHESHLETAGAEWLNNISIEAEGLTDESAIDDIISKLSNVLHSMFGISGTKQVNVLIGKALSLIVDIERRIPYSNKIMRRLLIPETVEHAVAEKKRLIVVNSLTTSTAVACFIGIDKVFEKEIHRSPDQEDNVDSRVDSILSWLKEIDFNLHDTDGIACRTGFVKPVPTGTYRIVPEMIKDLENPRIDHASNMSSPIAIKLAELCGGSKPILLTTSDPVVSDESDIIERLTGLIKIKRDGTGAHYLNHRAVLRIISSILERQINDVDAITAHMGKGMSIALHRNGIIPAVVDAFSGIPTSSRCGPLDLPRLIDGLKTNEITLKELDAAAFSKGGLYSLAGTNDFRAVEAFRLKGATEVQQKKIDLIFDFYARQITASILKLISDGKPIDFIALTGGIAQSHELMHRIEINIAERYPIVSIKGSFELESLASGLIRGFYEPHTIKDYTTERDTLKDKRRDENRLIDTELFDRSIHFRKKDAPILTLDELIDATCLTVKENYLPTIAIVGAENEDAILAAKRANDEGKYRIAKFNLIGDFAAINQIAYDYDLIIDNDNYIVNDTENPIDDAIELLKDGQAHLVMKGSVHSASIMKGMFHYLKNSGKLKPGELMSHVFVMDIPVRNKLLLISDAAVNTYPDVEKRIKIIENSLKVAKHLNIKKPKVAVISAIESVNQSIESSIDAEKIAKIFADREDCIVEGPLSFDVAMDSKIAAEKKYKGKICGTADVLIMPDIDAGNVLYKSLTTQSRATSAGVILCGDTPMILTSRGDSARSKLASISLAVKLFFDMQNS